MCKCRNNLESRLLRFLILQAGGRISVSEEDLLNSPNLDNCVLYSWWGTDVLSDSWVFEVRSEDGSVNPHESKFQGLKND